MTPQQAYEWLKHNSIETTYLVSTSGLLAWDQRTYMPKKGGPHRAEQIAVMAKLLHERATNPKIDECLTAVENSDLRDDPTSTVSVNVREWREGYEKTGKIPKRLAVDLARATTLGEAAWEKAKEENNWDSFSPHLKTIVSLLKQKTEALGYDEEAYDALIDEYESGEKTSSLETIFASLKDPLVSLLKSIEGSSVKPKEELLRGHFPKEAQEAFSKFAVCTLGYDFGSGRLDLFAHPFSIGIGPGDVRITTRYNEANWTKAVFGTIHESGHAMYEQSLPKEHWGTPRGQVTSLGIHESQSRLWENLVGRSRGFWRFAQEEAASHFSNLKEVDSESLLLAINHVCASPVRVEADEVTYNLHILLRFELELALMRNDLSIDDLPGAWNEKMNAYLGITPENLASGILQDVHWGSGLIGYFPTYTLGNLAAAQMFAKAEEECGDLESQFARGDFSQLKRWLSENVYRHGGIFKPRDLIKEATGSLLSADHFLDYCKAKFGALYKL